MALKAGNGSQGYHFMKNTKATCLAKAKLITLLPAPQICYFWLCFCLQEKEGKMSLCHDNLISTPVAKKLPIC